MSDQEEVTLPASAVKEARKCLFAAALLAEDYGRPRSAEAFRSARDGLFINAPQGVNGPTVPINNMAFIPCCIECSTRESNTWWKCCQEHTTEHGRDVVCVDCLKSLHPSKD